jgi:ABC-type lipoprotein export system ATPase subunit
MKKLPDHRRPGVWIAPDRTRLPSNITKLMGLVIVLPLNQRFVSNKVYQAQVSILTPEHANLENHVLAKLSFLGGDKETYSLSAPLSRGDTEGQTEPYWMPIREFQKKYCPIVISIGSRQSYLEIFERLSPDLGRRLLLAANDVTALNEFSPGSQLLRKVRLPQHELWAQFYREDEERFSLIAFPRLLNQRQIQSRSLAKVDSIHSIVPIWKNRFELPLGLNFPTVLGERQLQNVIIGPNGSGKTSLLVGLAKCVAEHRVKVSEKDSVDRKDLRDSPIPVAVFTYEPGLWSRLKSKGVEIHQQGVRANNWRQLTQLIYDLGTHDQRRIDLRLLMEILQGFIDVKAMHFRLHPSEHGEGRWEHDRSEMEVSLPALAESPRSKLDDALSRLDRRKAPFMRSPVGHTYELSSGERSLVLFCAKLMKVAKKGALLLIDEPENHLHPKFITLMVQTLSQILLATESRALLVTHSPFVVREFERSTVKILKLASDGTPELFRPAMQTLGGDVSMISDYVFEDENIVKGFELSIDRALRMQDLGDQGVNKRAWAEKLAEELGEDAVSYLLAKSDRLANRGNDA